MMIIVSFLTDQANTEIQQSSNIRNNYHAISWDASFLFLTSSFSQSHLVECNLCFCLQGKFYSCSTYLRLSWDLSHINVLDGNVPFLYIIHLSTIILGYQAM